MHQYSTQFIESELSVKKIKDSFLQIVEQDLELRLTIFFYFENKYNRNLALKFLRAVCSFRKKSANNISAEVIMLVCYIVGMHKVLDDTLEIWKAKNVDFDTFAGVDIQLIAFAGIDEALDFLKKNTSNTSKIAYDYTLACQKEGDFDHINTYFSKKNLPYYFGEQIENQ